MGHGAAGCAAWDALIPVETNGLPIWSVVLPLAASLGALALAASFGSTAWLR